MRATADVARRDRTHVKAAAKFIHPFSRKLYHDQNKICIAGGTGLGRRRPCHAFVAQAQNIYGDSYTGGGGWTVNISGSLTNPVGGTETFGGGGYYSTYGTNLSTTNGSAGSFTPVSRTALI